MNGWWRIWGIQTVIIPDGYVEPSPFLLHLYPVTIRLLRSKVASDVIFIRDDKQIMQYLHHAVIRWLSAASVSLNFLDCLSLTSPVVWYCRTSVRYWGCFLDSVAAFGPLSTTVSKQESLHDIKSAHNSPKNGVYRHTQTCKTQNIDFSLKQNLNLNRIKPL